MPTWSVGAKLRNKEPEGESETFHADFQITNIQTNIKLNRYVYIYYLYFLLVCLFVFLFVPNKRKNDLLIDLIRAEIDLRQLTWFRDCQISTIFFWKFKNPSKFNIIKKTTLRATQLKTKIVYWRGAAMHPKKQCFNRNNLFLPCKRSDFSPVWLAIHLT